jgi:hypothetical protein
MGRNATERRKFAGYESKRMIIISFLSWVEVVEWNDTRIMPSGENKNGAIP